MSSTSSSSLGPATTPESPPLELPESHLEGGRVLKVLEKAPLCFRDRFEHFTWAWYALPMTTGGLSNLLSPDVQPFAFPGLLTIARVFYVWSLVAFAAVTMLLGYRFTRWPHTFRASIRHPTEGLYVASLWLSLSNMIPGMARFGIPPAGEWLAVTYHVLFWIYFACTFCSGLFHYVLLYILPELRLEDMTPAWDMHSFPILMSGTIAATGGPLMEPRHAMPMLIAGLTSQGLGFLVSLFMNANYTRRMVQWGFPNPKTRPAMFIAVGPPAYTALGILGLADAFPKAYANYFGEDALTAAEGQDITMQVLRILAVSVSVFIWSLGFWFFCIAAIAMLCARKESTFSLNWWSFIFPNTGLVIATIMIGQAFRSDAVMWVGSAMTILLVVVYFMVAIKVIWAVFNKEILWPGKDEDTYQHEIKAKMLMLDMKRRTQQAEECDR